jgi:hypothetical protein
MMQSLVTTVKRSLFVALTSFSVGAIPVLAQGGYLNQQAWQAQQGMQTGALNPGQAVQVDQQIGAVQQQVQAEKAAQGGQLTPFQQQTLQNQMHTIGSVMRNDARQNGVNPQELYQNNGMGPGTHHFHRWQSQYGNPYNQYPPQNAAYYQNGGYPVQNGGGYGYSNGPNPYYPNGNIYQQPNGIYAQQQQGGLGGLSGAGNLLKRLF